MATHECAMESTGVACSACGAAVTREQTVTFVGVGRLRHDELALDDLLGLFCNAQCALRWIHTLSDPKPAPPIRTTSSG